MPVEIAPKIIEDVLRGFFGGTYTRGDFKTEELHSTCLDLFMRDSECIVVRNENGFLCSNYPSNLIIPVTAVSSSRDCKSDVPASDQQSQCQKCAADLVSAADYDEDNNDDNESSMKVDQCDLQMGMRVDVASKDTTQTDEKPETIRDANDTTPSQPPCPQCYAMELQGLFKLARMARTRCRFVVPVMQVHGKNICRSGTLARQGEVVLREAWTLVSGESNTGLNAEYENKQQTSSSLASVPEANGDTVAVYRRHDIALLDKLRVRYICDLMVEEKKVKFGFEVTSSEKVDKQKRYATGFDICVIPYPGCELFSDFKKKRYCATSMAYDWNGCEVNARLNIPKEHMIDDTLSIAWDNYRQWNLVLLTQNYMRLLMRFLTADNDASGKGGLLIHCISGWDRTPLFVSLLRMSLWADGHIHSSLSADELLYLTITYDWLLFGHCLGNRVDKGEEIMLFCFDFLQFLEADEFALPSMVSSDDSAASSDATCSTQDTPCTSSVDTPATANMDIPDTIGQSNADIECTTVGHISARATDTTEEVAADVTAAIGIPRRKSPRSSGNTDGRSGTLASSPLACPPLQPTTNATSKPIAIAHGRAGNPRTRGARTQPVSFDNPSGSPSSIGSWHMLSSENLMAHSNNSLENAVAASLSDSPNTHSVSTCSTSPPDEQDEGDTSDDNDDTSCIFDSAVFYSAYDTTSNDGGADRKQTTCTGTGHGCVSSPATRHLSGSPTAIETCDVAPDCPTQSDTCTTTSPYQDTSSSAMQSLQGVGKTSGSTMGCMCPKCIEHRTGTGHSTIGPAAPDGHTSRAQRLHSLRTTFLPIYRRCCPLARPNGGKAVWDWMSQMLAGKAA
eukprot:m.1030359 g.1030359  ORF g.1030359 m.1030359 type:complete len:849 (-) comp24118_c0_seq18:489-3035(-)